LLAAVRGWQAGSIGVAIQVGALLAILLWLWRDIVLIGQGLWRLRKGRLEAGTRLLVKALIAALPWILLESWLGRLEIPLVMVGLLTVFSALAMGAIDAMSMTVKRIEHLSPTAAIAIGLTQLAALLPGIGRVAVALTMARMIGLERPAAYRFVLLASLLVSTLRSGILYSIQGISPGNGDMLGLGFSFVLVLLAVAITDAWIRRASLLPFALYRLVLGGLMIWISL
jgi:undecaprenyl-diphosphatase